MKRGKPILGLTFTLLAAAILLFAAPASASYELIAKWGSAGSGDGQFSGHLGVATDSKDNVYVADSGNHRIQKFDSSGNFLAAWGSSSWGIATDSMDNVYVTDGTRDRQRPRLGL
ncbi:MAG: hypothetical protein JJE23_07865 [Thermoleophilia bacterium]|nr:hypothetical protein [Thermoleophilia bacterium]